MEAISGNKLLVADAMDPAAWTLAPDIKLEEALVQMTQRQVESCVVIEKNGMPRGAVELKDLLLAQAEGKKKKLIGDIIAPGSWSINSKLDLLQCLEEMKKRKLTIVAVIDGKDLKGEIRLARVGQKLGELLSRKDKEILEMHANIQNKDEYLGLVSHDMRAPLTVISLCTDFLLAEDTAKTLSPDQKSFIDRIKRNGELAVSMIHDILDVVRLDHGFQLDYQKILFSSLLQECTEGLSLIAGKKNIKISVINDQEIQVNLDSKRIRQVIENLVINAIKFSPQGGLIFVRSWLVQRNEGSYLALQIRDQGQGIRKEDESKVLEAFVQGGRAERSHDGIGLGLAIVRKFVEFHQGFIEVDGGWQKGATITVFLPGANLMSSAGEEVSAPKGPVILLVEDDESIREFYKQSLDSSHYHVLEAANGVEGLALFQQNRVDLVLSDIRMPLMDGLELLAKIRTLDQKVPIILCSGYYVGLENDLSLSDHKPDRIIDKPFKVKYMIETIEEQLSRYKQVS